MPVYEYYCQKCDAVHELWQSMYDTDSRECPHCEIPMQKLISKSSFQLKGGGWYADGYCRRKEEKGADNATLEKKTCGKAGNSEKPACASCSQ